MARTDEEIRAFIRQQLPVPVPAPPPKLAIGGLAFFSFYHLLLVSFFVTVERFPEIQYFVFLNYGHVHTALYSMLSCIEAFYGLSFLSSLPKKADNIAVEYAGLMLANAVLSNHMIYMVNSTMFIYTCIWWSICLVLMFIRIGYDVFTQCRDKMFPPAVADNNNNACASGEAFANSSSLSLKWELGSCEEGLAYWDYAFDIVKSSDWERFLVLQNESGLVQIADIEWIRIMPGEEISLMATGPKGEVTEPSAKRPKMSKTSDVAKLASPQSSDADIGMPSPHAETTVDKNKQLVNSVSQSPKASTPMRLQEPSGSKQSIQPSVHVNRYKLDNRPTALRIIPPLPVGLANVAALKEHLPYGELSAVELEDVQVDDSSQQEARLNFTTRGAAEQAFIKGKCWKEHNLKFMWVTPTNSGNATIRRERSLSAPPREPLDATDGNSEEKLGNSHEANVSDDDEHKDSETKNGSGFMKTEQDEDLQCPTSQESSAKQSPEDNVC